MGVYPHVGILEELFRSHQRQTGQDSQRCDNTLYKFFHLMLFICNSRHIHKNRFLHTSEGNFPTKSSYFRGIFREMFGGFYVDLFFAFFLEKSRRKKSTTKIHGKIQIRLREFRGQNPHCQYLALPYFFVLAFTDWRRLCNSVVS